MTLYLSGESSTGGFHVLSYFYLQHSLSVPLWVCLLGSQDLEEVGPWSGRVSMGWTVLSVTAQPPVGSEVLGMALTRPPDLRVLKMGIKVVFEAMRT